MNGERRRGESRESYYRRLKPPRGGTGVVPARNAYRHDKVYDVATLSSSGDDVQRRAAYVIPLWVQLFIVAFTLSVIVLMVVNFITVQHEMQQLDKALDIRRR